MLRFLAFVRFGDPSGCWVWTGATTSNGYGRFKLDGKTHMAHRVSWEMNESFRLGRVYAIPEGIQLDHRCRNRACVNPGHLREVSPRENVLCGDTITARNASKTTCDKGHPLSGDNLYTYKSGKREGKRRCLTCERENQRLARATDSYRQKHAEYERARRAARRAK